MKYVIVALLVLALCLGLFLYNFNIPQPELTETTPSTQDTESTDPEPSGTEPQPKGVVRIVDGDAARSAAWDALGQEFSLQTGAEVRVLAGDSKETPTIVTLHDPAELEGETDKYLDLAATDAYAQLSSWELTLKADGKVCGIAAEVEGYGLIYNAALLAQLGHSRNDITDFSKLKAVAELITATPDLGFTAFASPDMDGDFAARLASIPGDVRAFWDLYIANTSQIMSVTADGSLQELLDGRAVFYLGSTADYESLSALGDHQLEIMPVYTGAENEQQQTLSVTVGAYWGIRADAPELDVQASVEFLKFLVHPRQDGTVPVDDLGLFAPYRQATYAANPLEKSFRFDLAAGKVCTVCVESHVDPVLLSRALMTYAAAPGDDTWAQVLDAMGR